MDELKWLLGLDVKDLNVYQMALRGFIIYLSALILVRIGDKRFLGKTTAFDYILGVIVGSLLSRAINGQAELFPSIITGILLVGVHWLFGTIAFHHHFFGYLIKGKSRFLIKNGEILWDEMKASNITEHDLRMELRNEKGIDQVGKIKEAKLERNGIISFIMKESKPEIIDVNIEEGIKTIKIKLS